MVSNNAFRTNKYLVVLTEVLGLLLGMSKTELVNLALLLFLSLLLAIHLVWLSGDVHAWTYSSEVVHLLFVVNIVCITRSAQNKISSYLKS